MILAVAAVLIAVRVGDDGGTRAVELLADARKAVEADGSYRFTLIQGVTGAPRASQMTFRMTGSVDVRTGRTQMVFTSAGGPLAIECTYITDGKIFYTKVHETKTAEIGAAWLRSDLGRPFGVSGFQFAPEDLYADAQNVFTDLERTGTGEVRGVKVTEYSGTLDLTAVLTNIASPTPTALPTGFPATLSLDDRGRLVRVEFEFGPSGQVAASPAVRFVSTMDLYDFGAPAAIEIPADAKAGSPSEGATACYPAAIAPNQ